MKSSKAVRLFCGGPEGVTSLPPPSRAPVPFGILRRRSAGVGVCPACWLAPSAPSSMTHAAGLLHRRHMEKQPLCTPFRSSSADAYDAKIPRKLAHGAAGMTCSVPRSTSHYPAEEILRRYKLMEKDALESAKLVALVYLQNAGIIFIVDINLSELTKCEAELADCKYKPLAG